MRQILLALLLTYESSAMADCKKENVEYRAIARVIDGVSHLELKIPEETDSMYNPVANFILGEIQIPMYEGFLEDGWLIFEPSIPTEFVDKASVSVYYTFKPIEDENGVVSFQPCSHRVVIDWKNVSTKSSW